VKDAAMDNLGNLGRTIAERVGLRPEVEIRDLLNRRSDLSTFLVHLTKGDDPKASLLSILSDHRIRARTAMGWAKVEAISLGSAAENSQKAVCFSETPLDQTYSLFAEIARRQVKLKPYGLAFTRMVARRKGTSPVWYIDMTPGYTWTISAGLNTLRTQASADEATFVAHPAAAIFPFCEGMGTWDGRSQREFWWEREWRHVGDFRFFDEELALVLCPEADHRQFEAVAPGKCIDPSWSLERMIAKLVGLSANDVTPFASR
jgi:hypothetical protein